MESSPIEQFQPQASKQSDFLAGPYRLSSNFQSGNLMSVRYVDQSNLELWLGADPKSSYRSWFHFSISNVQPGSTLTFTIMNMTNQVKLFRQGHSPVYKINSGSWQRIPYLIPPNAIIRGQQGYQFTFKHVFPQYLCTCSFAFCTPYTNAESDAFYRSLITSYSNQYLLDYVQLTKTTLGRPLYLFTMASRNSVAKWRQFEGVESTIPVLEDPSKIGIFVSARVHPGETASSFVLNGLAKYLVSKSQDSEALLNKAIIYIVPIVNPDGVAEGNFRTDSKGQNLNRHYSEPSPIDQPEIYAIKKLLVELIKLKKVHSYIDLHAHVNKQGAFMYGNSLNNVSDQTDVFLLPKLMSFNCPYFDYESCNFTERNMASKDREDQLSKEGASRVAIFKETGLHTCWTLEVNYNSAKILNIIPKPALTEATKYMSDQILLEPYGPEKESKIKLFNIEEFQEIGNGLGCTIGDFFMTRKISPAFGSKLKNINNIRLNLAIGSLRIVPFKFDHTVRKILGDLTSTSSVKSIAISKLSELVNALRREDSPLKLAEKQTDSTNRSSKNSSIRLGRSIDASSSIKIETKQEKKVTFLKKRETISSKIELISLVRVKEEGVGTYVHKLKKQSVRNLSAKNTNLMPSEIRHRAKISSIQKLIREK